MELYTRDCFVTYAPRNDIIGVTLFSFVIASEARQSLSLGKTEVHLINFFMLDTF